jgi:hypothetical protein
MGQWGNAKLCNVANLDRLRRGDAVSYVEDIGDTGPIVSKIRASERA